MSVEGDITSCDVEDARDNSGTIELRSPVLEGDLRLVLRENPDALPHRHAFLAVLNTNPFGTAALLGFGDQFLCTVQHVVVTGTVRFSGGVGSRSERIVEGEQG